MTVYFDTSGKHNTDSTLKAARKRADELGIRDVVVSSTTGSSGLKACRVFKGFNLVVVRHHTGFEAPCRQQMKPKSEKQIIRAGAKILTSTHSLSGVERSVRVKRDTVGFVEIMADTLRTFGVGIKVCIEIMVMAADAGLISANRDVIAIGGTKGGVDAAVVIQPAHSNNFFDMFVREIIAKPRS
jgi:hypothetical protein